MNWSDGVTTAARTDTNVTANLRVTANFAINHVHAEVLRRRVGGSLSGTTLPTVAHGASRTQVTAVPNTGYHFVNWSDGVTTAARDGHERHCQPEGERELRHQSVHVELVPPAARSPGRRRRRWRTEGLGPR